MVKNFWKKIVLVCGNNHQEMVEMNLINGPASLFYACPKYYPENRSPQERACANRINLIDFEAMVNFLSEKIETALLDGGIVNLKNVSWTYKKAIDFKVLEHTEEKIVVQMLNRKALK